MSGNNDLGENFDRDQVVETVVGELQALLKGDTGFPINQGDVEFFPGVLRPSTSRPAAAPSSRPRASAPQRQVSSD